MIKEVLGYRVIAVVGLSKNPGKPSNYVPRYMQEGIVNKEATELAEKDGALVVMDRCMMKEHRALYNDDHTSISL
jgi:predicted CoA-binding protein